MKRIIPIFVAALIWSVASAESTAPKTAMGFIISDGGMARFSFG